MKKVFYLITFVLSAMTFGQVGINSTTPKTTLDVTGKPTDNTSADGVIAPRLTGNQLKSKDALYIKTTSNFEGQTGAIVFITQAVTGTPAGKTINVTSSGYYYFDGDVWKKLNDSVTPATSSFANSRPGAVKIAMNQSNFLTLSGTQAYGLLMQNSPSTSTNPTYVTGVYPGGVSNGSPSDIVKVVSGSGANNYALLEAPINGNGNFYRLNMSFIMGNNPPAATKYFNVRVESIGTGALIYEDSIVVPGGLNTGHETPFQIFFSTIADNSSINVGYRLVFRVDTAASQGLPGQIGVKIIDIARINQ
ncbi:hypothetical protein [Chishuiella changwenlii]|jgi:hypothetical protein|uniref:hypothetical protein n=1 Tax=Chishuiella changwenlii TaxID=1434701 RepID=UPI002FD9DBA8